MLVVEVCLSSDDIQQLRANAETAFQAGAARIELCADMNDDGLTPDINAIAVARKAFGQRPGLMVMIRPRAGNFVYSTDEANLMQHQIEQAAMQGADGVVFGAVSQGGHSLDIALLEKLINVSKGVGMQVGIHRAFDVVDDYHLALTQLITLGADRVLTSGMPWYSRCGAMAGFSTLSELIKLADNRIEIVIAGGVSSSNAQDIVDNVATCASKVSLHAYSGVLNNNRVVGSKVAALVNNHESV